MGYRTLTVVAFIDAKNGRTGSTALGLQELAQFHLAFGVGVRVQAN